MTRWLGSVTAAVLLAAVAIVVVMSPVWRHHRDRDKSSNCTAPAPGSFPPYRWIEAPATASTSWVIGAVGDGYTCDDQSELAGRIQAFYGNGLTSLKPYESHKNAFGLALVPAESRDATIWNPANRKAVTALQVHWNSDPAKCYVDATIESDRLIAKAVADIPHLKTIWTMVRTPPGNNGGCARGNLIYLTEKAPSASVGHEFGHAIGGLQDEYVWPGKHSGGGRVGPNCSETAKVTVEPWASLLAQHAVGPPMEGCLRAASRIYRPTDTCRMKMDQDFCEVCRSVLDRALGDFGGADHAAADDFYTQIIFSRLAIGRVQGTERQRDLCRPARGAHVPGEDSRVSAADERVRVRGQERRWPPGHGRAGP